MVHVRRKDKLKQQKYQCMYSVNLRLYRPRAKQDLEANLISYAQTPNPSHINASAITQDMSLRGDTIHKYLQRSVRTALASPRETSPPFSHEKHIKLLSYPRSGLTWHEYPREQRPDLAHIVIRAELTETLLAHDGDIVFLLGIARDGTEFLCDFGQLGEFLAKRMAWCVVVDRGLRQWGVLRYRW